MAIHARIQRQLPHRHKYTIRIGKGGSHAELTAVVGLVGLVGCTSASKSADMGDMALPNCTITLSGALSGSFVCTGTAIYESGKT
jgi:hypothetical protein